LDTLWEDSLHVAAEELPRFRRAMHTAAKVLAEAEGRLGDLKRLESGGDERKWKSLRARMERTLFGLDRYLTDTEAYWLPTTVPAVSPSPDAREGPL
jgi:acyl transferase domain-containing protein